MGAEKQNNELGGLVPFLTPNLITGENSAAELLKRIKTEREKLTPKKKTRKSKRRS